MLGGAAIVLATVNAKLALTAALVMPPIAVLTYFFAHRVFPISREVQRKKGHLTEASDEVVVGIEMVQAFGREDDVRDRFADRAEAVRKETMRQASVEARFLPGLIFLPTLGHRRRAPRRRARGDRRQPDDRRVHALRHAAAPARVAARGARLDHQPRSARDRRGLAELRVARRDRVDARAGEHPTALPSGPLPVRFEDVRFRYTTGAEVLAGIDLEVEPGEIVAICGPTGAGKTSLLNLLPRFYDPTSGRVLVGGVDARDVALAELRSAVAIVTQKPVLFSVPLRDNLLAARPGCGLERRPRRVRGGGRRGVRGRPPGRLRHADRRARRQPLRRPAPARRARAGAHRRGARDRARRPDVGGRHARPSDIWSSTSAPPSPAGPCSSPASGCRRCSSPTARSCSRDGRDRRAGPPRGPDPRRRPVRRALRRGGARGMRPKPHGADAALAVHRGPAAPPRGRCSRSPPSPRRRRSSAGTSSATRSTTGSRPATTARSRPGRGRCTSRSASSHGCSAPRPG